MTHTQRIRKKYGTIRHAVQSHRSRGLTFAETAAALEVSTPYLKELIKRYGIDAPRPRACEIRLDAPVVVQTYTGTRKGRILEIDHNRGLYLVDSGAVPEWVPAQMLEAA